LYCIWDEIFAQFICGVAGTTQSVCNWKKESHLWLMKECFKQQQQKQNMIGFW
jgi:hypothetical protein